MRAFLSHSTQDAAFVGAVAKHLGREFITYQEYSFDYGEQFRKLILDGLDRSDIFVFFVSKPALASMWVNFELGEAENRMLKSQLDKALAIRLDSTVSFEDFPEWLREINTPSLESPAVAARLIKDHIIKLRQAASPDLFIGRSGDLARLELELTPSNRRPPGMVALYGLPGIGRRSLAKRVMRNILDLQRAVMVEIEPADSLGDLRIKLAAQYDRPRTTAEYKALAIAVEKAPPEENLQACVTYLASANSDRELVVLVDQGGMIDDSGEMLLDYRALLNAIYSAETVRVIIVSRRKPGRFDLDVNYPLPCFRVDRIGDEYTKALLSQLAARDNLSLVARELDLLTPRVAGYPPAAYHAVRMISDYGKEAVLRDGRFIIDFRETSFLRLLNEDNRFSDTQRLILEILPQFDALPLPVLGQALGANQQEVDSAAMALVDMALLGIDQDGFYSVSDPVREVIHKVFGKLASPYDKIADAIDQYTETLAEINEDQTIPLSLARARFKAYVLSNRGREKLFYLASDLARLQQTFYHRQEYERSIQIGQQALEIRHNQLDVLKYLARAFTQLERYEEAEDTVAKIRPVSMKEAKFSQGFLLRKRGETDLAIDAYEESLALGMRGAAIHRELGQCLFDEERYEEAATHLQQARGADPDNRFVIDYEVQVAIAQGDYDGARKLLVELERVEDVSRYKHRLSRLESAVGRHDEAFVAAREAVQASARPQFEVLAQYVSSALRVAATDDARQGLTLMSQRFRGIRSHIQNVLWTRYYLAACSPRDALNFWSRLSATSKASHQKLAEELLEMMAANGGFTQDEFDIVRATV